MTKDEARAVLAIVPSCKKACGHTACMSSFCANRVPTRYDEMLAKKELLRIEKVAA